MNSDDVQSEAPAPKRRGRPPGSGRKAKETPAKKASKRRGGGRRKKTVVVAPTERQYTCFLGEDGGLQLCRLDGQGEAIALTAPDALGIAAFVERHRSALSS